MSSSSEPAPAVKVPVGPVTRAAYRTVFSRLGLIFELGWIPILVLLAALLVPSLYLRSPLVATSEDMMSIGFADLAQSIVALLCLSAFAVRWHQAILVGDPRRLPAHLFFRAWFRFLLYMLACYLVAIALIVILLISAGSVLSNGGGPVEAVVETAGIVIGILVLLGLSRCSLMFPAAARDRPLGVVAAWRLMRGNVWRLAAASFVAFLPVMLIAGFLIIGILGAVLPTDAEAVAATPPGLVIVLAIVETVTDFILAALGATILAAFYRSIVEQGRA